MNAAEKLQTYFDEDRQEWMVDELNKETGAIESMPLDGEALGPVRRMIALARAIESAGKERDLAHTGGATQQAMIDHFTKEAVERCQSKIDILTGMAEEIVREMHEGNDDDLPGGGLPTNKAGMPFFDMPDIGKFMYRKTREKVFDALYVGWEEGHKAAYQVKMPDLFRTKVEPDKKAVLAALKDKDNDVQGFSLIEATHKFEFKGK